MRDLAERLAHEAFEAMRTPFDGDAELADAEVDRAVIAHAIRRALEDAVTAVWDSRTIEEAAAKIGAL